MATWLFWIFFSAAIAFIILWGRGRKAGHSSAELSAQRSTPVFEDIPKHEAVLIAADVDVVGTKHRKADVRAFLRAYEKAEHEGLGLTDMNIRLEREPENPHDEFAIKVYGEWGEWPDEKSRHIGYVGKKMAYKIGMSTEPHEELVCVLQNIFEGDEHLDITFDVLVYRLPT